MLTCRSKLLAAGGLAIFWLAPCVVWSCSVPVFRYALERWSADAFQLTVFHREPLSTNQEALIAAWKEAGEKALANVAVEQVNVSGEMSAPLQATWKAQTNAPLPWVVVQYPPAKEIELPVWTGPLGAEVLKTLLDSPVRREIVRRLGKGDSVVWLLLESGNKTRDEAVATMLENESRKLEKTLELPEAAPDGPQVQSELPLKIAFSTVRLARNNPAEQMLWNMLLHIDKDLAALKEPMVFALFGRGRALPLPPGRDLRAEVIGEAAEFLTGACSCEVKSLNPGFDLLLAANWDALLEGRVVKDPELPPLIGMGQFAAAALATNQQIVSAKTNVSAPPANRSSLTRNLYFVLGFALVGSLIGTVLLNRKAKRLLK